MHRLLLVSSLATCAAATILNETFLPSPQKLRLSDPLDDVTPAPPEPFESFESSLLAELDPLERLPMNITERGLELFEGDIVLTKEQLAGRKGATNLWPNGYVPFVITSTSTPDRAIILSAILHWRYRSCLYFSERSESYNSGPHIRFIRSGGCWSYVGRRNSNSGQPISIGVGCNTLGIVAHEIGHAIGFWHEQSRRDRNSYISVLFANIQPGREHNFQIQTSEQSRGVAYDLSSLMHYGGFGFTRNGQPTIITNDVLLAGKIGQRRGLSFRDRHLANELYNCDRWCVCIPRCRNGGFVDRYCRCRCPPGTTGYFCERTIGSYYGYTCGDQNIRTAGLVTSRNFPALYPPGEHCIWQVTAPAGRRVRVQFHTARVIFRSGVGCWWDWIAVHTDDDSRPNRVACGTELQGVTFTTTGTRLVIEMHSFRVSYPTLQTGFNATVTFF